jgi:serine phosphatase RsbU (regulator of sigma subunit)
MSDAPSGPFSRQNAVVLIVDDDDLVRRAFKRVLEHWGFTVAEARDGASGLDAARRQEFGAVLLDLRMPGMDGLDVLSVMVQEHPDIPVIVVSGQGTMSDVVEALRRGAWDFISKPVPDSELLVRTVGRALEKSALLRQNREYSSTLEKANRRLSAALEELRTDEQAARSLQFQLLPEDGFRMGSCSCFRRLLPAQVLSGDFLDYFPLVDRYLGFYVADVAGHGAASAFVTAILTTLVHKYREALVSRGDETILHPQQFLTRIDADLTRHRLEKHVTMFYGLLEASSGRLVYANAGAFPFPFVSSDGEVIELESAGRPLNLPGLGRFGGGETLLAAGGRLLMVSDGVLELEPKQSHRQRRETLAKVVRSAKTLDAVLAELGLSDSTSMSDDVALLLITREESRA